MIVNCHIDYLNKFFYKPLLRKLSNKKQVRKLKSTTPDYTLSYSMCLGIVLKTDFN